jgi:hypothetical protein
MKNLRTKHVGGLAGSWLSRFADCFWIKNGTRVGVCSSSFAAETMCFGGPGHPLYVHRVGAMAAAATVFFLPLFFFFFLFSFSNIFFWNIRAERGANSRRAQKSLGV